MEPTTKADVDTILSAVEPCPASIPRPGRTGEVICPPNCGGECEGTGPVRRFPELWVKCKGNDLRDAKTYHGPRYEFAGGGECACTGIGWVYAPTLERVLEAANEGGYILFVDSLGRAACYRGNENNPPHYIDDSNGFKRGHTPFEAAKAALAASVEA